jgi:pimeloyl-ACP methyl ester carboxylesterase
VRWWRSVRPWPAGVPVLRVDGELDTFAVGRSGSAGPAPDGGVRVILPGVGHLVPEEAPAELLGALLRWLPEALAG